MLPVRTIKVVAHPRACRSCRTLKTVVLLCLAGSCARQATQRHAVPRQRHPAQSHWWIQRHTNVSSGCGGISADTRRVWGAFSVAPKTFTRRDLPRCHRWLRCAHADASGFVVDMANGDRGGLCCGRGCHTRRSLALHECDEVSTLTQVVAS